VPADGGRVADDSEVVPALVPARMLNEFTYCPRLFFLEWVQAQWASNDDTAEGDYAHRNVDAPAGRAPLPGEDVELRRARSVTVSSDRLGLVATIDVLEGIPGAVRPVDTKKGDAPATPEGAWEPERVQVCAQGLLLREQGYRCDEGIIYFAGSRQRVTVPFDEALVARTLELLRELRTVAARDLPPAPLVDSPKCPRCSLVGICLPDETNALAGRQQLPLRRLLPRDPADRPLYVTEQGAVVGRDGGRVEVRRHKELIASYRLIDISQLCVFGNVQVSTPLLRELFTREVPVLWFTYGGWFSGIAHGLPSKHVELRRRQVATAHQGGLAIARAMVEGKVRNARTLLRRNARSDVGTVLKQLQELIGAIPRAETMAALLGHEGAAARSYFGEFAALLRSELGLPGRPFVWDGRNRRPPRDAINCLLSYAYSLLIKDLVVAALAVGFDPYLGFYHRPRFGRPALALDLAEEFRPLVADSVVINLINNAEIRAEHFVVRAGGVALTAEGRRAAIRGYERRLDVEIRHPLFGYRISYRRLFDVQTRLLAAHVLGETPHYVAFTTR
jgi:CRISPR-associated protein Cas1